MVASAAPISSHGIALSNDRFRHPKIIGRDISTKNSRHTNNIVANARNQIGIETRDRQVWIVHIDE
jgi:hypothetical protein